MSKSSGIRERQCGIPRGKVLVGNGENEGGSSEEEETLEGDESSDVEAMEESR